MNCFSRYTLQHDVYKTNNIANKKFLLLQINFEAIHKIPNSRRIQKKISHEKYLPLNYLHSTIFTKNTINQKK